VKCVKHNDYYKIIFDVLNSFEGTKVIERTRGTHHIGG
jgi:hypothetical protein